MLCHWRYVLDNIFGQVKGVFCLGATHISERIDENGKPYIVLPMMLPIQFLSLREALLLNLTLLGQPE